MHPSNGDYIALDGALITGNIFSLTHSFRALDDLSIPELNGNGFPIGITVDWERNYAYLSGIKSKLYQLDLNSNAITILIDDEKNVISYDLPFSSIAEDSGMPLIHHLLDKYVIL